MRGRISLIGALCLIAAEAAAHIPPAAWLRGPESVGEVVDERYAVRWIDSDLPSPTSTVTFSFYYTAEDPPTFPLGVRPTDITGALIAQGVREWDTPNELHWDTSSVPAGTYRLWSVAEETPPHMRPAQLLPLSLGLITVAHPGDPVHPAVSFTSRPTEYLRSDERIDLGWMAFDPDGTGTLTFEVSADGVTYDVIDSGVPATVTGTLTWSTATLPEGDYHLRATLTDARGLSFTAYSQFFVVVLHIPPPTPVDAGVTPDAGAQLDAGEPADAGAFDAGEPPDAGAPMDASPPTDAGFTADATLPDPPDAGAPPDAASPPSGDEGEGSCAAAAPSDLLFTLFLLPLASSRRRRLKVCP